MPVSTLVPNPRILEIEGFISDRDSITIKMRSTQSVAACPRCDHSSRRIHSRYVRHLADLPWAGVAVRIDLKVKKFFCDHGACAQKIFTERLA